CSTADSAKTLIVHDFAYESKCETPIIAGDTIGDTTTVAVSNLLELNAEIFVYNKQVFVSCKVSHQLEIFDSSGKKILDSNRQQGAYNIDMQPFPKGIYIVKLTSGSQMISKTISM
ncbi:MAG TPA: T9SS type A sorting domain-containing protein, partial [Chitinophagales bacterium]|nr:T9SS type A sorting domain-containing protein [Chitinophagales bacterium]